MMEYTKNGDREARGWKCVIIQNSTLLHILHVWILLSIDSLENSRADIEPYHLSVPT